VPAPEATAGNASRKRIPFTVGLPGLVPGEDHRLAGWVFAPEAVGPGGAVVVAVPGGTRTKEYYDLQVPGLSGYSFAEHLTARGHVVVALDHLGVGGSTRPRDAAVLGIELMAEALARAVAELRARVGAGTLPGVARLADPYVVGVGSSVGGAVVLAQQARSGSYDALVTLGTPAAPGWRGDRRTLADEQEAPDTVADGWDSGYVTMHQELLRPGRYWPDVPDDAVRADEATATVVPKRCLHELALPRFVADFAAQVTIPVLLVHGERDHCPDPHGEPASFLSSRDITVFVVARSAHYHNVASTRAVMWNRIDAWMRATAQLVMPK
jgi:alpha-beta hydrolase superfamily lysophospholipase